MSLFGLTTHISSLEPVAALVRNPGSRRVYGLLSAARPAVTAAVTERVDGAVLVVTAHLQSAVDLAQELAQWTDRDVQLYPALDTLPYERVRIDRTVLAQRERVARAVADNDAIVVVAPVRGLLQPQQPAADLPESTTLRAGDSIDVRTVLQRWIAAGYAETSVVEDPGTFARRGGVLDIYPTGADRPVRIELFGNDVESLREFDPATQRSVGARDEVTVDPIAGLDEEARLEALASLMDVDTSGMNAEAQTAWLDDLARLEARAGVDELAVFMPYLLPYPSLVSQLLPGPRVVVDGEQEVRDMLADLWNQAEDVQRTREVSGDLPRGLRSALVDESSVSADLRQRLLFAWCNGSAGDARDRDFTGLFVPAPVFAGRLRSLVQDLGRRPQRCTVIATQQGPRLSELLVEDSVAFRELTPLTSEPVPGVTLTHGNVAEGWALAGADVVLLSDHEVFGRARTRPVQRRRAARAAFFTDFSPGDYVVHLEHGIGRFDSITRMSVDGAEREYALIQFAGADRVYVPTDQLERLTRYVGVGDTVPHLSKLGGGEWQRARQRAKKAAEDIAHELVDLYSKRLARPGYAFSGDTPWQQELESSFPYPETPDQMTAVRDVKVDMEEPRPMDRLVTADVGYGKTEVAVRAAFKAVMDSKQVAVLVPTTVLAQQHFETFSERLAPFPVTIEVLSRFRTSAEQKEVLARLAAGEVDIVIGTHRLLQKDVTFKNLGLLVIDEEQRFGVKHKERLKQLRESIDVLTLTATPIPRTLHMTLVGIREVSVIETAPEGRLPIRTYLQPFDERLVREAVLRELDRDGQIYIVHNKVASIDAMAERIRRLVPEARILVGHGQMEDAQLERVMLDFAHHRADVLVSSTIIENGLDIPNVNTIIVNNAHTLGLTQLYQLRGRVGRSANQAYAYLLYPRDVHLSHDAARRLEAVFEAQDLGAGFNIAMKDLEIRGAGNLLGAEQSGNATAIGFDLYTRMVSDAVERLRGVTVEEPPAITIDLPLTRFLPAEYVGNEAERLRLYRRLAAVATSEELRELAGELRDRFGPFPVEVDNLITAVEIKLAAGEARVNTVSLSRDVLVIKSDPSGLFDRVALYRAYGGDARISGNMLRIPATRLGSEWLAAVRTILSDMARLRASLTARQPVEAAT
jgi:transcription-repair coupling factor (superfamily II helicase)